MFATKLLTLAISLPTTFATIQGFNYGSTFTDGSPKAQSDFQTEFATAKSLIGTSGGFTSARLYTTIQGDTTNTPISAIPAAIAEGTTLLLGLWASAGQDDMNNEIAALTSAISTYGSKFADLVTGISVGSEDLYRITPTGIAAKSGAGADPATLVDYISQVRKAIAGTALSNAPVGHVDTWTAWVNGSNSAVIDACDFIGMDAYPYFQSSMSNSIDSGSSLFFDALDQTQAAVGGKEVWVTETGWPVSGPTENLGVPSTANAKTYWDEVGCALFGKTNTYWYTVQDAAPTTPSPSFGVIGSSSTTPLFDLTCPAESTSSSSSFSVSASTSAPASTADASSATVSAGATTVANIGSPGLSGFSSSDSASFASSTTATTAGAGVSSVTSAASVATIVTVSGINGTLTTVTSMVVGPIGTSPTGTNPSPTVAPSTSSALTGDAVAKSSFSCGILISAMIAVIAAL